MQIITPTTTVPPAHTGKSSSPAAQHPNPELQGICPICQSKMKSNFKATSTMARDLHSFCQTCCSPTQELARQASNRGWDTCSIFTWETGPPSLLHSTHHSITHPWRLHQMQSWLSKPRKLSHCAGLGSSHVLDEYCHQTAQSHKSHPHNLRLSKQSIQKLLNPQCTTCPLAKCHSMKASLATTMSIADHVWARGRSVMTGWSTSTGTLLTDLALLAHDLDCHLCWFLLTLVEENHNIVVSSKVMEHCFAWCLFHEFRHSLPWGLCSWWCCYWVFMEKLIALNSESRQASSTGEDALNCCKVECSLWVQAWQWTSGWVELSTLSHLQTPLLMRLLGSWSNNNLQQIDWWIHSVLVQTTCI